MFARVAYTVAAAAGLVLAAIAVLASPAAAVGWVVAGVLVAAMATALRRQDTRDGAVPATTGPGRSTGPRAGAATCAGGLVLTGVVRLLGPSSGIVILTLLLLAAPLAWFWPRRRYGLPAARGNRAAGCPEVVPAAEIATAPISHSRRCPRRSCVWPGRAATSRCSTRPRIPPAATSCTCASACSTSSNSTRPRRVHPLAVRGARAGSDPGRCTPSTDRVTPGPTPRE